MAITYHNTADFELISACVKKNMPVLLMGETGTGKTTLIRELARKEEKKFIRINLNGQTTREDLLGKFLLIEGNTVWQDGILLTGIKEGYWILLDEINAALPEVLLVLQALLEVQNGALGNVVLSEKDGEIIQPHEETRIFGTCNPSDYTGMKDFNMATLSRFIVLNINPMDRNSEAELLEKRHKMDKEQSQKLSVLAEKLRGMKNDSSIQLFVSTRDLEQVALLVHGGIDISVALEVCVIQKAGNDSEKSIIREQVALAMDIPKEKLEKSFVDNSKLKKVSSEYQKFQKQMKDMEKMFKDASTSFTELPF